MKRAAVVLAASLVVGSFMASARPAAAAPDAALSLQQAAATLIRDGIVTDARVFDPAHPATRLELAALAARAAGRVESGEAAIAGPVDLDALHRLGDALGDELDELGAPRIDVAALARRARRSAPPAPPVSDVSVPYGLSIGLSDDAERSPGVAPSPVPLWSNALRLRGGALGAALAEREAAEPLTVTPPPAFDRPHLGPLASGLAATVKPLGVTALRAALPESATGATVALTYRSFFSDPGGVAAVPAAALPHAPVPGDVGERVFGIEMAQPLLPPGAALDPALFTRFAQSSYAYDGRLSGPIVDTAGLVGLRLSVGVVTASLQYQQAGAAFVDGLPPRLMPDLPAWSVTSASFVPEAFGYAHPAAAVAPPGPSSAWPSQAFLYPVLNPFVAGTGDSSGLAPNERGFSATLSAPIQVGALTINARAFAQHLSEIRPGVPAPGAIAAPVPSTSRANWDKLDVGGSFTIPVFRRPVAFTLGGSFEHLKRNDKQIGTYVPYAPGTDFDASALAPTASLAGTAPPLPVCAPAPTSACSSSAVRYYPNYVSAYHTLFSGTASVPVTRDVVVGLRYSGQQYYGAYGTTDAQNVLERNNQVDLSLTYRLSQSGNSVGFAFRNSTYKDYVVPSFNYQQNREDLNFTVRF